MEIIPLTTEERAASNFTHKVVLKYTDCTGEASGTAFAIFPKLSEQTSPVVPIGTLVQNCAVRLVTLFVSASMTECDLTIGDDGDADRFINSSSIGGTTTPPTAGVWYISDVAKTPYIYTATNTIDAVITVTGGSLATLTAGELHIYLSVVEMVALDAGGV